MATLVTELFDGGTNGATVTTSNTGAALVGGAPTFSNAHTFSAGGTSTLAMRCNPTAASASVRFDFTSSGTVYGRAAFYLAALPTSNFYIMQANLSATQKADLRINTDGKVAIRNSTTAVYTSSTTLTSGAWYQIVWGITASGTQRCWVYNSNGAPVLDSGDQTFTTSSVDRFYFGSSPSTTGDVYVDFATIATTIPTIYSNVTPPSVNAGVDQASPANSAVTLTATVTDPDSAATGTVWSQTSGPTVSLSGSGSTSPVTRTFTPTVGGTYVFTATTSYAGGTVSDTVSIRIRDDAATVYAVAANAGGYGNFGGAADIVAALNDALDTTGAASPTAPSGASAIFELTPLNAGIVTVTVRHDASDSANSIQRVLQLRTGSSSGTVVGTTTVTLPTTAGSTTVVSSVSRSADEKLYLQITDTQL